MKSNEVSRRQFSDNGQSWFSHYYACWANNHRGWQKMKKKNKRVFKKKFRRETEREIEQELSYIRDLSCIDDFREKCKEISNKFKIHEDAAGCFLVNYREDADICRDCSRINECSLMQKQLQNGN